MAPHDFYRDDHVWDFDNDCPVPRWNPDSGKPWKPGKSKGAFIWPRDKKMRGPPTTSWQRWKDLFTGKGPAIFVGDRTRVEPARPVWSNWMEFDDLGYQGQHDDRTPEHLWRGKRYDFNARKYTADWYRPGVWSDVKWGRDQRLPGRPAVPLYIRDHNGVECSMWSGSGVNEFRYNHLTSHWDWKRPQPWFFWQNWMDP